MEHGQNANAAAGKKWDQMSEGSADGSMSAIARGAAVEANVECRMSIVDELVQLRQGEHALLMCEVGMGRSSILKTVRQCLQTQNSYVLYVDYAEKTSGDPMNKVFRKIRSMKRNKKWHSYSKYIIIMDNVSIGGDEEVERLASQVHRVVGEHFCVIIGTLPEGEILMEELHSSSVYWSCDMCLDDRDARGEDPNFFAFTHNIPSLATAFLRLNVRQRTNPFASFTFVNRYNDIVESMQREQIFGEERALIAVMLILGTGTRAEVEDIVGDIDYQVWRSLARDEPLLGVDVSNSTFRCVGAHEVGSLSSCVPTLLETLGVFRDMVLPACRHLVERGQYGRAAVAAQLIDDKYARCKFTFPYAFRFLNEMECNSVFDAYSYATSSGWNNMEGYTEIGCYLKTLFYEQGRAAHTGAMGAFARTTRGRYASLSSSVRQALKKWAPADEIEREEADDEIAGALVSCGQGLRRAFGLSLAEGLACVSAAEFDCLDGTVVGSIARTERVLLTYLLEGTITTGARESCLEDQRLLDGAGLRRLSQVQEAALHIPQALFGHEGDLGSLRSIMEFDWQNASARGDKLFRAALCLGMGACDLRGQGRDHLKMALFEFGNASSDFKEGGAQALAGAAKLLTLCVQALDHSSLEQDDFMALLGASKELDRVIWVVMDVLKVSNGVPREILEGLEEVPQNLLWLLSVLGSDLGRLSADFLERFPESWVRACQQAWYARRIAYDTETDAYVTTYAASNVGSNKNEKPVRINVLGGFEIVVGSEVVRAKVFNTRKANTLLTLLAAAPMHTVHRGEILESVFPGEDLAKAGKLLNQSSSLINTTIRKMAGLKKEENIVHSDRYSGIVSLDPNLVVCDTDLFLKRANSIGDHGNDDWAVVTIAREIEDIYRGDLCIPDWTTVNSLTGRDAQLQGLFVDAMVLGAESAGAISRNSTACRFITLAYRKDPMREDVVIQYIKAFSESGRCLEAEKVYDEYVLNLMTCAQVSPSKTVRRVAATYFGNLKQDVDNLGNPEIDIDVSSVRPVDLEIAEHDDAREVGPVDFDYIKGAEDEE